MSISKQHFEDFNIGNKTKSSIARTISEYDLYSICNLYGTRSEIHLNKPKMKNSEWGERVIPGIGLSVIMVNLQLNSPWSPKIKQVYGFDKVRYLDPVTVGDTVYLTLEVLDLDERGESDRGLIRQKEELYKTHNGKCEKGNISAAREGLYLVEKS